MPEDNEQPEIVAPDSVFADDAPITNLDMERFKLNRQIARIILALFAMTTLSVIVLVIHLASIDVAMIRLEQITPADRLITEKVIMAVIAATFVQVGAAAYLIVQSLFKSPEASDG